MEGGGDAGERDEQLRAVPEARGEHGGPRSVPAELPGPRPRALAPGRPPALPVTGAASPRCYFSRWGQIGLQSQGDAYRCPLPPLRPRATSAMSPLAGLDFTADGDCHHHQWSPLFGVPCAGRCWQRDRSVTAVSPARWALPRATTSARPLESHRQLGCHSVVLSCRASLGWLRLGVTPRPAPGASAVPELRAGAGGALSPWQDLHHSTTGVLHKCFLSQPAPGQCWRGLWGPWVGSGGPGGLFTAAELCFLPPAPGGSS